MVVEAFRLTQAKAWQGYLLISYVFWGMPAVCNEAMWLVKCCSLILSGMGSGISVGKEAGPLKTLLRQQAQSALEQRVHTHTHTVRHCAMWKGNCEVCVRVKYDYVRVNVLFLHVLDHSFLSGSLILWYICKHQGMSLFHTHSLFWMLLSNLSYLSGFCSWVLLLSWAVSQNSTVTSSSPSVLIC